MQRLCCNRSVSPILGLYNAASTMLMCRHATSWADLKSSRHGTDAATRASEQRLQLSGLALNFVHRSRTLVHHVDEPRRAQHVSFQA